MIGLDTNVLVRYLTQDDPAQAARATRLMEQELSENEPGYVGLVALAETTWVLQRLYRASAAEIRDTVADLLWCEADRRREPRRCLACTGHIVGRQVYFCRCADRGVRSRCRMHLGRELRPRRGARRDEAPGLIGRDANTFTNTILKGSAVWSVSVLADAGLWPVERTRSARTLWPAHGSHATILRVLASALIRQRASPTFRPVRAWLFPNTRLAGPGFACVLNASVSPMLSR